MGEVLLNLYYGKHPFYSWKTEDEQYIILERESSYRELFLKTSLPDDKQEELIDYLNVHQERDIYVEELIFKKAFALGQRVMYESLSCSGEEAPEYDD
ncbi:MULTISPECIES: DUF6809 family protein [Oscillospiraceae]|uniref:Uncharacterized protein n=1 Tax=Harryflintia acetispora TaxID=1849041 RepID=A0A9X8ULD0_9FIRM|nr:MULTISPECIES: DUF6809 family protein [Oscillospiraceae]RGB68857.1 hypothetical protein DW086_03790 [Harryflintia acetispora]TCL45315.1 hypothetical protein EDD78_101298 [Harryflintia acetispora]